eukprot:c46148_g1_i1.p1 GENE.c46148_g1_i1~~c46148_g1_i1.p1  ORF type:complete len:380 (-),score=72.37 c46148_g1_i1:35-1153(-)
MFGVVLLVVAGVFGVQADTCSTKILPTDGLLLIDVQNDFMEPFPIPGNQQPEYPLDASQTTVIDGHRYVISGSVPVQGSSSILDPIRNWVTSFNAAGAPIFVSVDWHEAGHCSFCRNGTAANPYFHPHGGICAGIGRNVTSFNATGRCQDALAIRAFDHDTLSQWPDHCVEGTFGARLTPFLRLPANATFVKKGFIKYLDSYSAFGGTQSIGWPAWNDSETGADLVNRPSLAQLLAFQGVTRVFVMGLATDFCVKMSSIDAKNQNFGPVVTVTSASRGVTAAGVQAAMVELNQRGVIVPPPDRIAVKDVMTFVCANSTQPNNKPTSSTPRDNTGLIVSVSLFACLLGVLVVYVFLLKRAAARQIKTDHSTLL